MSKKRTSSDSSHSSHSSNSSDRTSIGDAMEFGYHSAPVKVSEKEKERYMTNTLEVLAEKREAIKFAYIVIQQQNSYIECQEALVEKDIISEGMKIRNIEQFIMADFDPDTIKMLHTISRDRSSIENYYETGGVILLDDIRDEALKLDGHMLMERAEINKRILKDCVRYLRNPKKSTVKPAAVGGKSRRKRRKRKTVKRFK